MTPLRLLVNAIVGGFLLFAWNAIASLALGLDEPGMRALPVAEPLVEAVRAHVPDEGLYRFAGPAPAAAPSGLLLVHPQGRAPESSARFLVAYLADFLVAFLAGFLLWLAAARVRSFAWRAMFVASLGLLAGLVVDLPLWNERGFPGMYALGSAARNVVGLTLVGLFLAWRMRFRPTNLRGALGIPSRP